MMKWVWICIEGGQRNIFYDGTEVHECGTWLAQGRQAIKGETVAAKEMREAIEGRRATPPDSEGKNAAMTITICPCQCRR